MPLFLAIRLLKQIEISPGIPFWEEEKAEKETVHQEEMSHDTVLTTVQDRLEPSGDEWGQDCLAMQPLAWCLNLNLKPGPQGGERGGGGEREGEAILSPV